MRTRLVRCAGLLFVGSVLIAGCSGSGTEEKAVDQGVPGLPTIPASKWKDETGKSEVIVDSRDNVFIPENIQVSPGTKIVFENTGRNPHNVIPGNKNDFAEIPVSKLQPGDRATVTIDETGEFPYYCSLHGTLKAGMKGRIKVAKD